MNESKKTIRQRYHPKEEEVKENKEKINIVTEIEKQKNKKKENQENKMIKYEVIDYARRSTILMDKMKQNEKKLNQLSHVNYDNNLKNVFKIKYD